MEFGNPIVGLEELIRSAIRSKDYVASVSGWRIARDGTAEFSSVVIRTTGVGTGLVVGPNTGPQVIVRVQANGALIELPTNIATENALASIFSAILNQGGANEAASLQISSASVDTHTDRAALQLNSQNSDGSSNANWNLKSGSVFNLVGDKTKVDLAPEFKINGVSQGRGVREFKAITANSAASAVEAVAITADSTTFVNGRAYEILLKGFIQSSAAGDRNTLRVRKGTGTAGTIWFDTGGIHINAAGVSYAYSYHAVIKNASGADITTQFVMNYLRAAGAGNALIAASASNPAHMYVRDIGAEADFPDALAIT